VAAAQLYSIKLNFHSLYHVSHQTFLENSNQKTIISFVSPFDITISLMATLEKNHQVCAKCPNGTHKSPNGICEQVAPYENSGDDDGDGGKTISIHNLGSEGSSNNDNKDYSVIY
jgi:hypothetical protein